MVTAIQFEINILCLIVLAFIVYQSNSSVNRQMSCVLFRCLVYGIMLILVLDIMWGLVDGKTFRGAYLLNHVINAVFLTSAVLFGGLWCLYALKSLGFKLSRLILLCVMIPVAVYAALNFISIRTGWLYTITPDNRYMRGRFFFVQLIGAAVVILFPFLLIVVRSLRGQQAARRLLSLYIIPVTGFIASIPFQGMPGIWPCAAVSVVLLYLDEQNREIHTDFLTDLKNRRMLEPVFNSYRAQISQGRSLYMFMFDVDSFKQINDKYGHKVGDEALIEIARLLKKSVSGTRGFLGRFGGDEFMFMGFFADAQNAEILRDRIKKNFEKYKKETANPYKVDVSIGFAPYAPGDTLDMLIEAADSAMYEEKRRKKAVRNSDRR